MNENRYDIIDDLITRCLTGEATDHEQKQLASWIAERKENERYYLGMRKALELGSQYVATGSDEMKIDVDHEWDQFLGNIGRKDSGNTVDMRDSPPSTSRWLRIAAAVTLLVASGIAINYFMFRNPDTIYTAAEAGLTVTLPDGSEVDLNRNSELAYTDLFGQERREVRLKGEAFFDVKRNPALPFVIHAGGANIEVLGTSFNVRSYENTNEVEVTVATGVVKLRAGDGTGEAQLRAGERGIYSTLTGQVVQQVNQDANFLSWKTRKIVFTEATLQSVVETLNRVYGASIVLSAKVPSTCAVTVSFDHQTLEAVLNVLKDTLNLTYRVNGNQIEITEVGC